MAGCEAGIGGLQTRAHCEAARHDRPGEWTCDDVYAAGLLANIDLDRWSQAAVNGVAIGRACVALGLLQFRRKRFAPPISRKITRFIS
jgi:hypothetical protein